MEDSAAGISNRLLCGTHSLTLASELIQNTTNNGRFNFYNRIKVLNLNHAKLSLFCMLRFTVGEVVLLVLYIHTSHVHS